MYSTYVRSTRWVMGYVIVQLHRSTPVQVLDYLGTEYHTYVPYRTGTLYRHNVGRRAASSESLENILVFQW